MAATTHPRSASVLLVLVGLAAFGLGLLMMLLRTPPPGAHAQGAVPTDCPQANPDGGCWITLDLPVLAVYNDASVAHTWLVDVPEAVDFSVAVANLPADLEVSVFGPDGSLIAQSNRPGYQDEVVQIINVGPGTYSIVVDSPSGQSSNDPYTVLATTAALTMEPFDPYGNPSQYILPY
jgi:hypothetical protein